MQSFQNELKPDNIPKKLKQCKKFLRGNPDIIITKADKGNTTVGMKKSDYFRKTEELLLSDNSTYLILNGDPTKTIQTKTNKPIDHLLKNQVIDDKTIKTVLKCTNACFPKMYFLLKVHTQNGPLQPIVSFVRSPTYNLSTFLQHAFKKDNY